MIGALFVGRGRMTRDDLENDEVFSAAVNGLPKVVELITAAPEEKRSLALAAAHQAYRKRGCARSSAPTRATANKRTRCHDFISWLIDDLIK